MNPKKIKCNNPKQFQKSDGFNYSKLIFTSAAMIWKCEVDTFNPTVKLLHRFGLEWWLAANHGIKNNSHCPYICRWPVIFNTRDKFRSSIQWCATKRGAQVFFL